MPRVVENSEIVVVAGSAVVRVAARSADDVACLSGLRRGEMVSGLKIDLQ